MLLSVVVICLVTVRGMKGRQLVPGRYQSMAELSYVFVASMIRSTAGEEGMKFFSLVYSLFMFILVSNVIGIIPYTFTVSSHIIVTAAFALLVFFTVLIYGFYKKWAKILELLLPATLAMVGLRHLDIDLDQRPPGKGCHQLSGQALSSEPEALALQKPWPCRLTNLSLSSWLRRLDHGQLRRCVSDTQISAGPRLDSRLSPRLAVA
jgi:hypothetical protein